MREGRGSSTFRGLCVGHFVHLWTPLLNPPTTLRGPLAAPSPFIRPARRSFVIFLFSPVSPRRTKRKGTVILMRIRLVYAAISYLRRAAPSRCHCRRPSNERSVQILFLFMYSPT